MFNPPARSGLAPSHPQGRLASLRKETRYHPPVYICPVCNREVPHPVKRKCPDGHVLWDDRLMASTVERPAGIAFVRAFLACLAIAAAIIAGRFFVAEKTVAHILGLTLVIFIAAGIVALMRALTWQRRGGPVSRLVPHAVGAGLGRLLAGGGMLAIGFILGMQR
jgi:hypothetical protein